MVEGFPAGRSKSGGNDFETVVARIFRRAQKPELETLETPSSPFRFSLKSLHRLKPVVVVIVGINDLKSESLGITCALILADFILLPRKYIRIAVIDDGSDSVIHKRLDDCTRARGTACMEKDLGLSKRCLNDILLLLHDLLPAKIDENM